MNIDVAALEQCGLHIGPAIALSKGEDQQRMLTLSPFAVPMEQGIALLRTPAGTHVFHGVSIASLSLGIPQFVVEYVTQRMTREGFGDWRCLGYGLGLAVSRKGSRWQASLGDRVLAIFDVDHRNHSVAVQNLEIVGTLPEVGEQGYRVALQALIERYL
jgi:hypothetical protein